MNIRPEDVVCEVYPPDPGGMRVYRPRGVKVTHKPTGLSFACNDERSQHMNRDKALAELRAALAACTPAKEEGR